MKKGFSLITAIIFMVLIATLSLFSLNISSLTAKQTTDVFLREQAELLAQSATELAILDLLGRDFSAKCPTGKDAEIFSSYFPGNEKENSLFEVNVKVERIFGKLGTCTGANVTTISTPESIGTVILNTTVESIKDNRSIPPIRIHRRTIQKL
jgi:hypothetical protein